MRRLRFWLISIISFFTITLSTIFIPGSFLNRLIAIFACAIFSTSSTLCVANLSGRAIAVQPDTPAFTSSVKQLDADHAEIRLTFPKGCEFISHLTKTSGGIIQDSLQYSHNNLEACGIKPFTVHYSNVGKTIEIQIQGQNDRLRLDASANQGTIQQTYQDTSGKVRQQVTPIPKKILDYLKTSEKKPLVKRRAATLPNSRDSQPEQIIQQSWLVASNNAQNLYQPDSSMIALDLSACGLAEAGNSFCNWIDMITGVSSLAGLVGGLVGFALPFIPYLGIASLISETVCWALYGGFPPILGLVSRGAKEILVGKTLDEVNGLLAAARRRKRELGGLLKDNPLFEKYVNDINRLKEAAEKRIEDAYKVAPNLEAGEAVTESATAFNAYLEEFKDTEILSELIQGKLHDFLHDCKNPINAFLTSGYSNNDPHLATFDGLRYDLQSIGEVILTKSNDRTFEVQARQAPFSSLMAINSAVAVKVGSDRVALYTKDFPDGDTSNPLRVNGKPVTIQGNKLTLKGGGEILKQGSNYVISSPRGEKVLVSPTSFANHSFLNISPFVYNLTGKYSGLLGNVNGNPNDDLQIRGGGNISEIRSTYGDVNKVFNQVGLRLPGALDKGEKVYFDRLYKEFGDSWRVKQEESLFDYPAGKTTENYSDRSFPDKYLTLNMLSPEQIQKARNACTEAKITQDLMEGCIFDVGFSGFSEFARATAEINGYVNIVNQLFPGLKIPTTGQVGDQIIQIVKPKKFCPFGVCL